METVTDIESMTYGSSLEKVSDLVKQYDSLQIGLDVNKIEELAEREGEER